MRLLFLIACLASTTLVFGEDDNYHYGTIDICDGRDFKYVKPGDNFTIPCRSDHSIGIRIYTPMEDFPTEEELLEDTGPEGHGHKSEAERTTTIVEYEDATKGVDDGWYTCVVLHGDGYGDLYSALQCEVIILDICENSDCKETEICEPDYETGTYECTCNYGCSNDPDFLCSDTCEFFWNECTMQETTCLDNTPRTVASKGFCGQPRAKSEFRQIDEDIDCELGESIKLESGLVKDGTPQASIKWVFHADNDKVTELDAVYEHTVQCSEDAAGVYKITLMHCMDENSAVRNEYKVSFKAPTKAPTTAPPTTSFSTVKQEDVNPKHVCSSYPGGVIEDFNSNSHFYDLSCTHVLAADLMPGGDYTNPWFIYGTYDQINGKTALSAMTFYLSNSIFELQRGWIVHAGNGEKMKLKQDEPVDLGDSGCFVVFSESHFSSVSQRHLRLACPHIFLEVFYDGLMAGHIRFLSHGSISPLETKASNIGLCFNGLSGWRTNWQVGKTDDKCEIDGDAPKCSEPPPDSCNLAEPARISYISWTTCGVGASAACSELHCQGHIPTNAQECALQQANRMNCDLKLFKDRDRVDKSCPKNDCEWMKYVVSQGCYQTHPPFVCD